MQNWRIHMTLIDYSKAYGALALYILMTKALGLNFWQVEPHSRPFWLVGALLVLAVVVRWCRAPGRRSVGMG